MTAPPKYLLVPSPGRLTVPKEALARLRKAGVDDLLTAFLDGYDSDASRASMRRVARSVARDLFYRGNMPGDLAPEDAPWLLLAGDRAPDALRAYHEHLRLEVERREGTRDDEEPQGLSASTANQRLSLLRGLVKELAFHGAIEPLERDKLLDRRNGLKSLKANSEKPQPSVSDKDLIRLELVTEAMLEKTPNRAKRDRALLALTLSSGLRRDEAARAHWGDLHQEDGMTVLQVRGKGKKTAKVPVPAGAARVLEEWRSACGSPERGPILRPTTRTGDGIVHDRAMTPDGLYRRFRTLCLEAGIDARGLHALRRAFVTTLLSHEGMDLSAVQQLARHSNPTTTARYDRRDEQTILRKGGEAAPDPFQGAAA